jgi:hypothetical protein
MSTRAMRRGATTIATAGVLLGLSVAFAQASASARGVAAAALLHHSSGGPAYKLSFSPPQPKSKSNLTFSLTDSIQPSSVTLALPAGVVLNPHALPTCSNSPNCEPATQVGSGSASVLVNGYTIPLSLLLYNTVGGLSLVIQNPNGSPIVKAATWSGTQLMIPYPNSYYTAGKCASKPNGCPIVVTELSLTFNTAGVGSGNFLRTPSACTAAGWSSRAAFSFTGGPSSNVSAVTKCGKYAVKPKKKSKKK